MAYQDFSPEMLIDNRLDSPETRQRHLFDTYIQKMFKRRGGDSSYTQRVTIKWLSWLSQKMSQHGQSVFLMEKIQPSSLSTEWQRWLYSISVMLIILLPVGLLVGIGSSYPIASFYFAIVPKVFGIGSGFAASLAVWFAIRRSFNVISSTLVGLAFGLSFGATFGITFGQTTGWLVGFPIGIATGLVFWAGW